MEILLDDSADKPHFENTIHGIRLVMNPSCDIGLALASDGQMIPETARLQLMRLWSDPYCKRSFETGPGWVRIFEREPDENQAP